MATTRAMMGNSTIEYFNRYTGNIEVEDVYVFGCGMDYRGYWRGLPALYAIAPGRVERDGD